MSPLYITIIPEKYQGCSIQAALTLLPLHHASHKRGQDAALGKKLQFAGSVDAQAHVELFDFAAVAGGADGKLLADLQRFEVFDLIGFAAAQAQTFDIIAWLKLQRQDPHAHQIGAVNTLE